MAEFVNIEGLDDLRRALRELAPRVARTGLRAAVQAGAALIEKDAKQRAPVITGTLRAAIYRKQIRELSNNQRQTVFVGVRRGKAYQAVKRGKRVVNLDAYYWHWVEFGHLVVPRGSSSLSTRRRYASKGRGQQVPAKPFMRPAFEAQKMNAVDRIKQRLAERIEKERQALAK